MFGPTVSSTPFFYSVEPITGLIGWWRGNGNLDEFIASSFRARVTTGGRHSGTASQCYAAGQSSPTIAYGAGIAGIVEGAFAFDGARVIKLMLACGDTNLTGPVTVELWARRDAAQFNESGVLIRKGGSSVISGTRWPAAYYLEFDRTNKPIGGYVTDGGADIGLVSSIAVTDLGFHHYAYVRDTGRHSLFVDGVLVDTNPIDSIAMAPGNANVLS